MRFVRNTGRNHVNDFDKFGKTYQVSLQADVIYRQKPQDIYNYYVKNNEGDLVSPYPPNALF